MKNKNAFKQTFKLIKLLLNELIFFVKSKTGMLVCGIIAIGLIVSLLIGALFSSNTPDITSESITESETQSASEEISSELITEAPDYTPEIPESQTQSGVAGNERLTLSNMEIPDTSWAYFLINRSNPVPSGYINNIEFKSVYSNYANYYLDARAADFAECMINDAQDDGVTLLICSAYRSHERQTINFENRVKSYASAKYSFASAYALTAGYIAVPGTSEHETGLAIDFITPGYTTLDSGFEHTSAYKWLSETSYKYGFILRYPSGTSELTGINYEPWHFRFIGFEHAQKIYESGLCLEEYMEKDRESNPELSFNPLEALKVPAQPAWYENYLNPPADTKDESESNTDSVESDSTDTDVDSDSSESDSTDTDIDSDSSESDSTDTDIDSDSSESDSTDTDTDSDTDESDSTDTDLDPEDTYEYDTSVEDGLVSDSEDETETESQIESETEFSYKPITPEDLGILPEEDDTTPTQSESADTSDESYDTSFDTSNDTEDDTNEETDENI